MIYVYNKYKNKKSNLIYLALRIVTNKTDAQDGQEMVLYQCDISGKIYVREIKEFEEKFILDS